MDCDLSLLRQSVEYQHYRRGLGNPPGRVRRQRRHVDCQRHDNDAGSDSYWPERVRTIAPAYLALAEGFAASGDEAAKFDLARALAEAAWTEPAGSLLGTARYAAPEQVKGESVDGRADIYALSVTLVEAVTGKVPFAADTTIATLMARVDTPEELFEHL